MQLPTSLCASALLQLLITLPECLRLPRRHKDEHEQAQLPRKSLSESSSLICAMPRQILHVSLQVALRNAMVFSTFYKITAPDQSPKKLQSCFPLSRSRSAGPGPASQGAGAATLAAG